MEKLTRSGFLLAAIGTALFSCKGILVKLCYQHGATPDVVITLRVVFALPFYATVAWLHLHIARTLPRRVLWITAAFGLIGYFVSSLLDMYGLVYITASLERIILYTYPTLALLITVIFLKAPLNRAMALCIAIIYAGLAIVFLNPAIGSGNALLSRHDLLLGGGLVFAAALAWAIFLVATEVLVKTIPNLLFTSIAMIAASGGVAVYAGLRLSWEEIFQQSTPIYILTPLIAFFCTVLPSFMVGAAVQRIGAARTGAIGSAGPLITLVLAALTLGESITPLQLLGFFIVMGGVYWLGQHRAH